MVIFKIFIPFLLIVLNNRCKSAEVGRFYAFNHPPFDDNDNIPVAVKHNHEVRNAKSIKFTDNPTTFHPIFKTQADEDVTVEIKTVNSEFYEDGPTSYRMNSYGNSGGEIPVSVVYDKPEAVKLNERRILVQRRRKPIEDKELRTAGEKKLVHQTTQENKLYDGKIKETVEENIAPAVRTTQENYKTLSGSIKNFSQNQIFTSSVVNTSGQTIEPIYTDKEVKLEIKQVVQESKPPTVSTTQEILKKAVTDVKHLTWRGLKNNYTKNQDITSSVVSTTGKTVQHRKSIEKNKLSRHGLIKSNTDGNYNINNEIERVNNTAITNNTRTNIDKGTEFYNPSSQISSWFGMNRMMKKDIQVKDENEMKVSDPIAAEKEILHKRMHSRMKQPFVPIVELKSYAYGNHGDFHYNYEGADGTKAFERGELKYGTDQNSDEKEMGQAVEGGFSYTDAEGKDYSLTYTADENGYRPMGAHLPTPPPIPPAIARALEYLATKPTPFDEEVTKSWW